MTMLSSGHRRNSCVRFWTQIVAFSVAVFICEQAQPQQISTTELNDRITQDLRLIRVAEHDHLSNSKLGYLWGHLASDYAQQADFTRAEDAYFHSIRLLKDVPEAQVNYATLLDNLGVLYLAYNRKSEAHQYLKKAIVMRRQQDDRTKLGITLVHLAELAISDHKFKEAENLAIEAHASLITAEDDLGRKGFIGALIALAYARCSRNDCAEGLRNANEAMELAHITYPSESVSIGHALMGLGFAKWKSGDSQEAEKIMLQGVHLITTLNTPGAQYSRNALLEYRSFLQAMHRTVEVKRIDDQLATTSPQPCAACTVNVNSMSNSMR